MSVRILSLVAAAAMTIALPAMAANSTNPAPQTTKTSEAVSPAKACGILQRQWDAVADQHKGDAKFVPAREMRYEGGRLCSGGKASQGVAKLEQALKDIGLKPQV